MTPARTVMAPDCYVACQRRCSRHAKCRPMLGEAQHAERFSAWRGLNADGRGSLRRSHRQPLGGMADSRGLAADGNKVSGRPCVDFELVPLGRLDSVGLFFLSLGARRVLVSRGRLRARTDTDGLRRRRRQPHLQPPVGLPLLRDVPGGLAEVALAGHEVRHRWACGDVVLRRLGLAQLPRSRRARLQDFCALVDLRVFFLGGVHYLFKHCEST